MSIAGIRGKLPAAPAANRLAAPAPPSLGILPGHPKAGTRLAPC
jgi:hypothetical protein